MLQKEKILNNSKEKHKPLRFFPVCQKIKNRAVLICLLGLDATKNPSQEELLIAVYISLGFTHASAISF
jgi:hypothetical protein